MSQSQGDFDFASLHFPIPSAPIPPISVPLPLGQAIIDRGWGKWGKVESAIDWAICHPSACAKRYRYTLGAEPTNLTL